MPYKIQKCCKEIDKWDNRIRISFKKRKGKVIPIPRIEVEFYLHGSMPYNEWNKEIKFCPWCGKEIEIKFEEEK